MFSKNASNKAGAITSHLAKLRRISAYDVTNTKSSIKGDTLFPRFAKYMSEALWNNMYHRLYRSIVLNNDKLNDAGSIVSHIITTTTNTSNSRSSFIKAIEEELHGIFDKPTTSRTGDDSDLILAVTNQKNTLKGSIIIITTTTIFTTTTTIITR